MLAQGPQRPCGSHRGFCFFDPAGHHSVPIRASLPRLPSIRLDSPQLRCRHGYSPRRGWLSGVLPPAAAGDYVRGWDADSDPAYSHLEVSWPGTADRRLSMGDDVSGMVNANLVLPASEAGRRPGQFASFSCFWTLTPPAPNYMAAMTKSNLDVYLIIVLVPYQQVQHA